MILADRIRAGMQKYKLENIGPLQHAKLSTCLLKHNVANTNNKVCKECAGKAQDFLGESLENKSKQNAIYKWNPPEVTEQLHHGKHLLPEEEFMPVQS